VFVARDARRHDVVLADLGDPSSYLDGKHFKRFFFEQLAQRLAPRGVLGLPLTSPLRTPATYAGIVRTLRAAGFEVVLYLAPLPTLGEWGFALASRVATFRTDAPSALRTRQFPPGTSFVTGATLAGLFALPADAELRDGALSHLYDQPLVELYQQEEQALGE